MNILTKRRSVKYITRITQLSMLLSMFFGILLIPIVNGLYGTEVTAIYLKLFAFKAVFDICTAALGGGFVKSMLEDGMEPATRSSVVVFSVISFVSFFLALISCFYYFGLTIKSSLAFSLFVSVSFMIQPIVQRLSAEGMQHVPPIARGMNVVVFSSMVILLSIFNSSDPLFNIFLSAACGQLSAYILAFFSFSKVGGKLLNAAFKEKDIVTLISKQLGPYAIFASLLALTYQIEPMLLGGEISDIAFVAVIAGWKVPNLITQFIWRHSEVSAIDAKRKSHAASHLYNHTHIESVKYSVCCAVISVITYLIFSSYFYYLWLGKEVSDYISTELLIVFSLGVFSLCLNRSMTAFLQYTKYVNLVSFQYLTIIVIKLIVLYFLSSHYTYATFLAWFLLELAFSLWNYTLVKRVSNA